MLSLATILILGSCQTKETSKEVTGQEKQFSDQGTTQLVNPFIECATMEEAAEQAGFDLTLPKLDDPMPVIRVIPEQMIEVKTESAVFRKARADEAVSGDYNVYHENSTLNLKELEVTLHGCNGLINLAEWALGDFQYSIYAREGIGGAIISLWIEVIQ